MNDKAKWTDLSNMKTHEIYRRLILRRREQLEHIAATMGDPVFGPMPDEVPSPHIIESAPEK